MHFYHITSEQLDILFTFVHLHIHRIIALLNAHNQRSAALCERIGMKRDGCLRSDRLIAGNYYDEYVYSILENESVKRDKPKCEPDQKNIYDKVENNINNLVEEQVNWSNCASDEDIYNARHGKIDLKLTQTKGTPKEWLLCPDQTKNVLCLAGAGGLQAPILAAAGYNVTVYDLSDKMLEKDQMMAEKENLNIHTVHGNMCDMKEFSDGQFDMIINPASMMYLPEVAPVMKECYRVLRKGGVFIFTAPCPIFYNCDYVPEGGYYKACNRMPYKSYEHGDGDWLEFGHTMEEYLGSAIHAGFVIDGYYEDQHEDITELYFCARVVKL